MGSKEFSSLKRMNSLETKQMESQSTEVNHSQDLNPITNNSIVNNKSLINESLHELNEKKSKRMSQQMGDSSLFCPKSIKLIVLWYFFSFTTLFLNKYIVSYERGDTTMLGVFQLLFCTICSYVHLKYWHKLNNIFGNQSKEQSKRISETRFEIKKSNFTRSLIAVGSLRYSTILLGLIALWYTEVSFAETIKSSAPVFTVLISRFVLGEQTSSLVILSLLPVMSGLALCSAFELSFNLIGFVCSLATNLSECLQNVFSKKLLNIERYQPSQLQFYTSFASIIIQIPCVLILVNLGEFFHSIRTEKNLLLTYILAGISFHCQSLAEYTLLSIISPVTHSVANTAKRAFLIWLSVIIFGNPVTTLSWIGTGLVISGVFLYNKARQTVTPKEDSSQTYHLLNQSQTHDV